MGHLADVGDLADDGDLVEAEFVLALVVVDEGDGVHAELLIGQELLGDHVAGGASANDDCAHVIVAAAATSVPGPDAEEEAWGNDQRSAQESVERDDRNRNSNGSEPAEGE